jgi:hypothetical protein
VLALLPAGAEPEHHAAAAQVVQRHGLAGEHDRVAERDRRHARAEVDVLRAIRQVGERDDELERLLVGRLGVGEVV